MGVDVMRKCCKSSSRLSVRQSAGVSYEEVSSVEIIVGLAKKSRCRVKWCPAVECENCWVCEIHPLHAADNGAILDFLRKKVERAVHGPLRLGGVVIRCRSEPGEGIFCKQKLISGFPSIS